MRAMRVLVVGAGAIGRVLALHLARGGAEVCALVKPHQAAAARAGFSVVRRHRVVADELAWVRFADVVTSPAAVASADARWDAVFLCVASPALADRAWLDAVAAATGGASVVVLQPGLDDAARVAAAFGDERVVVGAMSLMAWAGDELADTEYWIPPFATVPLTPAYAGDCALARARAASRTAAIAGALSRGGLAARVHPEAGAVAALGSAVLESTAAALAVAGGRRALARDRNLGRLAAAAAREAITIVTASRANPVEKPDTAQRVGVLPQTVTQMGNQLGSVTHLGNGCGSHPTSWDVSGFELSGRRGPDTNPFAARVFESRVGPFAIDAILAGLDAIAPVTPDRFFALHYSKLALQSRETLAAWSARAAELGLASTALDDLRARLGVRRSRAATEARDVP